MANIAIFRINYKSDFILTLNSDAGWMTPFCIKFWTGAPSQAYFASFDGTTYTHCAPVEGEPTKLQVQFDDHHLPIGDLQFQIGYHFTVADFPTSVEDEVLNQASVIIEVDGEPAQVMLDLNGETAPEIEFSLPAYANEAQRIANEQERIAAEEARIQNEETRISSEQVRQQNETQRISREQARQTNETQRIEREQARQTNETQRIEREQARQSNEEQRIANETERVTEFAGIKTEALADHERAEADHTTATSDHTQAVTDHTQAEQDHTRAESDHTRAESDHAAVEVYVDSLGAFDISAYHATGGVLAKYADLTAALDSNNGGGVPQSLQKGGMSVKFVQSSDNKYIQARCMAQNFTTDTAQWQGVDDKPTAGSDNLVRSGGVDLAVRQATQFINSVDLIAIADKQNKKAISADGSIVDSGASKDLYIISNDGYVSIAGQSTVWQGDVMVAFYSGEIPSSATLITPTIKGTVYGYVSPDLFNVDVPANCKCIAISHSNNKGIDILAKASVTTKDRIEKNTQNISSNIVVTNTLKKAFEDELYHFVPSIPNVLNLDIDNNGSFITAEGANYIVTYNEVRQGQQIRIVTFGQGASSGFIDVLMSDAIPENGGQYTLINTITEVVAPVDYTFVADRNGYVCLHYYFSHIPGTPKVFILDTDNSSIESVINFVGKKQLIPTYSNGSWLITNETTVNLSDLQDGYTYYLYIVNCKEGDILYINAYATGRALPYCFCDEDGNVLMASSTGEIHTKVVAPYKTKYCIIQDKYGYSSYISTAGTIDNRVKNIEGDEYNLIRVMDETHILSISKEWEQIREYANPPEEYKDIYGNYPDPLKFYGGGDVTNETEWASRKAEIKQKWATIIGEMPSVDTTQQFTIGASEKMDGYTRYSVSFNYTPTQTHTAYLLVPDDDVQQGRLNNAGDRPAIVTTFYERETEAGLGRGEGWHSIHALEAVKRGYIALSMGYFNSRDSNIFLYPNASNPIAQPIVMMDYAAKNAYYCLKNYQGVDYTKIGIVGLSYGGKWAMWASMLVEEFAFAVWSDAGITLDSISPGMQDNYDATYYLGAQTTDAPNGAYQKIEDEALDLTELESLMYPRPFMPMYGVYDIVKSWMALNYIKRQYKVLGNYDERVLMPGRNQHHETDLSLRQCFWFFDKFAKVVDES